MNPGGQFNKSNADLKIRSSDGVVLDVHRVLLSLNTGTFPGPEFGTRPGASANASSNATGSGSGSTNGSSGDKSTPAKATNGALTPEIFDLTEPANVLRLCLDFVYPKRHPDLEDIVDFSLIYAISEAVGKYKIYAGMNTCNVRLRAFLPKHATEIFLYAIKYDHSRLVNEVIPYLARASLVSTLKQIPSTYMVPWSQFHEAWSSIFKGAIKQIKALPASGGFRNQCHVAKSFAGLIVDNTVTVSSTTPAICDKCRSSLLIWVSNLEEIEKVDVLKATLASVCEGKSVKGFSCCKIATNDPAPSVTQQSIISSWWNAPASAFGSTPVFGVSSMPAPTSAFGTGLKAAPISAFGAALTITPTSASGANSTTATTSASGANSTTATTSTSGANSTTAPTSTSGANSTTAPTSASASGTSSTAAPTQPSSGGAGSTVTPTSASGASSSTTAPSPGFGAFSKTTSPSFFGTGSTATPTSASDTSSSTTKPSPGFGAFSNLTTSPSAFGAFSYFGAGSTATPTSEFGALGGASTATPKSAFGAPSTSAFGLLPSTGSSTSAFGAPSTAAPTSAFGAPSKAQSTSAFGTSSTAAPASVFGTPAFGASLKAPSTSAFGAASTFTPQPAFGAPSTAAPTSASSTAAPKSASSPSSTAAPTSAFASLSVTPAAAPKPASSPSSTAAPTSLFPAPAFSTSAPRGNAFGSSAAPEVTPCCGHAVNIAKFLQKKIEEVPSFETFLAQRP